MQTFTFSIPAYNEGDSINTLVQECVTIGEYLNINYSILIINDGSTDQTSKNIDTLSSLNKQISVYTHEENQGFGTTIREVFQLPTSDWIFFLSGDNQFPASNLEIMIKHIDKYDFILGYRIDRKDPIHRKLYSFIYNQIISIIGRKRVHDVNSIALVKSSLVQKLDIQSKSAFIHAEIYLKALKKNANIIEVPIKHNERKHGEASGGKLKTILFTIFEIVNYLFKNLK
ncbi:MAG: glycosyltransferase family 2 protein [Bacteroidetes bacterium]|nr:glycosyltransferase family 2 protein [Bacteroidota bacterium]MCB0514119.1 glycosyltransferase family 2 protein [Bacteroidota bacterium]